MQERGSRQGEEESERRKSERRSTQRVEEKKEEAKTKRENWDCRVCCDLRTTQKMCFMTVFC